MALASRCVSESFLKEEGVGPALAELGRSSIEDQSRRIVWINVATQAPLKDDVGMRNAADEGEDGLEQDCSSRRERIRLVLRRSVHLFHTVLRDYFVLFLGFPYL